MSSGCREKIPENIRKSASCGRQNMGKIVQAVVYEQVILSTILFGSNLFYMVHNYFINVRI